MMKQGMLFGIEDIRIVEKEIPKPSYGEILVKTVVATTCGTDVKNFRRGYPLVKPPHPYGHEMSGIVESVGEGVFNFAKGDRVAVHNTAPCNTCYYCKKGQHSLCESLTFMRGAYAQYTLVPAPIVKQNMFLMPESMSFRQGALLEPFSCAVYGVSLCPIDYGDTVIINGAGSIGLMMLKLCLLKGAKVIMTDVDERRLEAARKMGCKVTVNVKGLQNPTEEVRNLTPLKRGGDVVIEATGFIEVWKDSVHMARKGGVVLLFGGTKKGQNLAVDSQLIHYDQLTLMGVFHTTPKHVLQAFELLKEKAIDEKDFLQNEYPLEELENAIREHGSGKVIKNCITFVE